MFVKIAGKNNGHIVSGNEHVQYLVHLAAPDIGLSVSVQTAGMQMRI
jgi:hypothetical protein